MEEVESLYRLSLRSLATVVDGYFQREEGAEEKRDFDDKQSLLDTVQDLPMDAREHLLEQCVTSRRQGIGELFDALTNQGVVSIRICIKENSEFDSVDDDAHDEYGDGHSCHEDTENGKRRSVGGWNDVRQKHQRGKFRFTSLLSIPTGLEHLDISSSSPHYSIRHFFALLSPPPQPLSNLDLSIAHTLTSLNVSRCEDITDGIIDIICNHFTSLKHLYISGCEMLTEESFFYIANLTELKSLDTSHNQSSTEALYSLTSLSCLESLNINCLRNIYTTEDYSINWRGLCEFRMAGLVCMTSNDIGQIISNSIQKLHTLEIGECSLCDVDLMSALESVQGDVDVSSDSVVPLKTLTPLRYLNLSWCEELSSHCISKLISMSPNINTLILQKGSILSKEISLIPNHCPHISCLNLALCSDVSNSAISSLSALTHLKELNIAWSLVEDSGVLWLLKYCPLRKLILQGCKELTTSLFSVMMNSQSSKKMDLELLDFTMVDCCEATLAKALSSALDKTCLVIDYYQSSYQNGQMVQEYYCESRSGNANGLGVI